MAKSTAPTPDFEAMSKALLAKLSPEAAVIARDFFKASFDKGGFTNYAFVEWPQRRSLALSHKLMMQSYKLRDSIEIAEASADQIVIEAGKGLPYATIHNTGGVITITVTEKMRKYFWYEFKKTGDHKWKWMALTKKNQIKVIVPQRKYIGDSHTLMQNINNYFGNALVEIVNKSKTI